MGKEISSLVLKIIKKNIRIIKLVNSLILVNFST